VPDLLSALPSRPLQARPPLMLRLHLPGLIGLCLLGGALVFEAVWITPGLATDWLVRDTAVPVLQAAVQDGACRNRMLIDDCDASLTAAVRTPAGEAGTLTRQIRYVFVSTSHDFTSRVLADPRRPEWLTTDLGLTHYWNRLAVFLVGLALLAATVWAGLRGILAAIGTRLSWRTASLRPVPLELVSIRRAGLGATWTVRTGTGRTVDWGLPRWSRPCVLGPGRILGLATPGEAGVLPIDAKLRWIRLSRQERRAALATSQAGAAGLRWEPPAA